MGHVSCNGKKKKAKNVQNYASRSDTSNTWNSKVNIRYSGGFKVEYFPGFKKVMVLNPSDTSKVFGSYILVEDGRAYQATSNDVVITVPVTSMASVSTTHLAFLRELNEGGTLSGFSGMKYVQDDFFLERYEKGKIIEIGKETELNREKVIELAPELLMVYPYEGMNYSWCTKAGVPVVYNSEYLELTPLGKAEWIKFFALFFNKENEAEQWFSDLENDYLKLKKAATTKKVKPTVFSGKAYGGEWHLPGGKSFAAQLLVDAGGNYLWQDDPKNNSFSCTMETVMDKALDADWWVIVGTCNGEYSLEKLLEEDSRYAGFAAFKNKRVLFCDSDRTDYFGKGVAEPQLLLKDLIYYFHPGVLSNYRPHYFELLQ